MGFTNLAVLKKSIFSSVLVIFSIGSIELILTFLAHLSPRINLLVSDIAPNISDTRLGHRPNPLFPDHDRNGYRNPVALTKSDIVALGDSQTYGTSVQKVEAWPAQLASSTGHTVYNMAFGGYGPVHSLILLDEAIALRPQVIIEAFYAGNDLYDSFDLVYNKGQFPYLKTLDVRLLKKIEEAESAESIQQRVTRMFLMENRDADHKAVLGTIGQPSSLRAFLSKHSKLYGLMRFIKSTAVSQFTTHSASTETEWETAKAFALSHAEFCQIFESKPFQTIFTSEYRFSALDLSDPRIAAGLDAALGAIDRMHQITKEKNIRFIVLLIPTKEFVFEKLWQEGTPSFFKLIATEAMMWNLAKEFFDTKQIEYLDALPALRERLAIGRQPYHITHDGHPNRYGHEAIAELVSNYIAR